MTSTLSTTMWRLERFVAMPVSECALVSGYGFDAALVAGRRVEGGFQPSADIRLDAQHTPSLGLVVS